MINLNDYNEEKYMISAIEALKELYDILEKANRSIDKLIIVDSLNEKLYKSFIVFFKNVIQLKNEERLELIGCLQAVITRIRYIEKKLGIEVNLKELEKIIQRIEMKDIEKAVKLIWYHIYRNSIYTIKVFDTENIEDKVIFKCAWYASLFEKEDANIIKNTKFYLIEKDSNNKISIQVEWGKHTYYKYDFPHEKIVNPYDNMKLIVDLGVLKKGDYQIYYEVFEKCGKLIISNSAVTRKLDKRIIKEEDRYKYVVFRTSSRVIYINVKVKKKNLIEFFKIKLNGYKYDMNLIRRFGYKRKELSIIYMLFELIRLFYGKKTILIGELPDRYEDSGSVLFDQLKTKKREFKYYYVTTQEQLIKSDKKFVKFGGVRHRILFLTSDILLNVQNIDLYMNPYMMRNEKNIAKRNSKDTLLYLAFSKYLINQRRIFLQHGVLYQSGLTNAIYVNSDFDYLVVSTEFEKKIFPPDGREFIETGLPRFSRYNKNESDTKKILFSPTWRKYFKDLNTGILNIELIKSSDYYQQIIELLTSESLNEILKKHNYKLIYNVHHTMNQLINSELEAIKFVSNVELKSKNKSLNELINECDICITDYSSLFFDFLKQDKAVIHYINDYDDFHNRKDNNKRINSYFNLKNYSNIGIIKDQDQLLQVLEQILNKDIIFKHDVKFLNNENEVEKIIKVIENLISYKND